MEITKEQSLDMVGKCMDSQPNMPESNPKSVQHKISIVLTCTIPNIFPYIDKPVTRTLP